jgi:hypothetical protein
MTVGSSTRTTRTGGSDRYFSPRRGPRPDRPGNTTRFNSGSRRVNESTSRSPGHPIHEAVRLDRWEMFARSIRRFRALQRAVSSFGQVTSTLNERAACSWAELYW